MFKHPVVRKEKLAWRSLPCQTGQKHLALSIQCAICPIKLHFGANAVHQRKEKGYFFFNVLNDNNKSSDYHPFFARTSCFDLKKPEITDFFQKQYIPQELDSTGFCNLLKAVLS